MATPQIWNGSAWVPVTKDKTSFWNGSSWVEPTDIKYWDGAQWVTVFGGGGGGGGPITLRATASNQANAVNTLDVTIPASVQDGDMLVLAVAQTSNATTVFNAISGWTKQGEQRAGTSAHTIALYTRLAQPGDASSTVTTTSVNTENYTAHLRAYAGVHQTTPLDTAVTFAEVDPAATSGNAPAVTVATADAMLIAIYSVPTTANTTLSAGNWTDPSGFIDKVTTCTTSAANNAALATYNQVAPGTGSQGPFNATITQSRRWATATVVLRPA
jgi:large repetitive protein